MSRTLTNAGLKRLVRRHTCDFPVQQAPRFPRSNSVGLRAAEPSRELLHFSDSTISRRTLRLDVKKIRLSDKLTGEAQEEILYIIGSAISGTGTWMQVMAQGGVMSASLTTRSCAA
jgi:hypothetical protein